MLGMKLSQYCGVMGAIANAVDREARGRVCLSAQLWITCCIFLGLQVDGRLELMTMRTANPVLVSLDHATPLGLNSGKSTA